MALDSEGGLGEGYRRGVSVTKLAFLGVWEGYRRGVSERKLKYPLSKGGLGQKIVWSRRGISEGGVSIAIYIAPLMISNTNPPHNRYHNIIRRTVDTTDGPTLFQFSQNQKSSSTNKVNIQFVLMYMDIKNRKKKVEISISRRFTD